MKTEKTFLILDGNALLHRAWHALPPLTTKDGRVVNAAYGFLMVIEKMREELDPDYMAVAWDLPGKTFRHDLYPEYKGHRKKKEQELYDQIPIIKSLLAAYHIPCLSAEGMEGDDVVGTVAHRFDKKEGVRSLIVTGDLDALQLVDDQTDVIFFQRGISQTKTYDIAAVLERYGLNPDQLIDYKALMGDSSDNIPGISGVGKKTAATLLQEYKTIDGIFDAMASDDLPEKYAKKLRGKEEELKKMKALVTIRKDADLNDFTEEDAIVREPDVEALLPQLKDLEFTRFVKEYEGEAKIAEKSIEAEALKKEGINALSGTCVYIHILEGQQDLFDQNCQVILSDGEHMAIVSLKEKRDEVITLLESAQKIVGHDLKRMMHLLGHECLQELFDVMVGGYVLEASARRFDLDRLAYDYLELRVDMSDPQEVIQVIERLHEVMSARIQEEELTQIAYEIEMPLVSILYRMERNGIYIDKDKLAKLATEFESVLAELTEAIYTLSGTEFNINSPSQLSEVLFETLELPTKGIKKTKTGYSTAASELEKLWEAHEIIPKISKYREYAKLKSTYIDALPKLVEADGRIHTTYNQTVAATGRLSSSDPNLQNIPIRTELGNEIRKAFVAPEGRTLVAIDYSQFELRIAAVLSQDETSLKAFQEGADIHRRTAALVLDKPEEEVTKEERSAAKAINFGILYGMGTRKLARSTGFSKKEAKAFIDRYFALHPGIERYIEETKRRAHEQGHVSTLFGRRRQLPEIHGGMRHLVAAAERMAVNMPIQGTQADLVKMAMVEIAALTRQNDAIELLLQVHDELVFEIDDDQVDAVVPILKQKMEEIWKTDVPLVADVEIGQSWGDMQPFTQN